MFGRTTARRFGSPARTPGPGDYARTPGDGTEPAHARHRSPTEEVMKSQVDEVARELETAGQAATRLKNDLDRLRDERDAWRRAATEAREAESQASARLLTGRARSHWTRAAHIAPAEEPREAWEAPRGPGLSISSTQVPESPVSDFSRLSPPSPLHFSSSLAGCSVTWQA